MIMTNDWFKPDKKSRAVSLLHILYQVKETSKEQQIIDRQKQWQIILSVNTKLNRNNNDRNNDWQHSNVTYNNGYRSYQLSEYIWFDCTTDGAMFCKRYISLDNFALNQYKDISKFAKSVQALPEACRGVIFCQVHIIKLKALLYWLKDKMQKGLAIIWQDFTLQELMQLAAAFTCE